jgi:hypothetical protein
MSDISLLSNDCVLFPQLTPQTLRLYTQLLMRFFVASCWSDIIDEWKRERRVKHIKRMCGIFIAWSSDNHFPLECDEIYKGQIRLFDVCVISGSTSLTSLLLISQCSRFSLCYLSFSRVRGWFDTVVFMCLAFSAYRLFSAFFSTHYLSHNNLPEKVIIFTQLKFATVSNEWFALPLDTKPFYHSRLFKQLTLDFASDLAALING